MELVQVLHSREKVTELHKAKIESFSQEAIVQSSKWTKAILHLLSSQMLIEGVGKEKAKQLTHKYIYDFNYKIGRAAAEKAGNPTDLDSFLEEYCVKAMGNIPAVPPQEIVERTAKRCVWGVRNCLYYEAVKKVTETFPELTDPDTMEVFKERCGMDEAWANGFNPKMKFKRIKFALDGDDGCYFECEVE